MTIHASCIAFNRAGILLLGGSGSGKSHLALAAIGQGAMLVADDRVLLTLQNGQPTAAPPAMLAGLLEVRQHDIIRMPYLRIAPLKMAVQLMGIATVPRLAEPQTYDACGVTMPLYHLAPFDINAGVKLQMLLAAVRQTHYAGGLS